MQKNIMLVKEMDNLNYSFSKAFQTEDTIKKIFELAFNKNVNKLDITLLDGGMKCAVYLISHGSEKVVLKIAPLDQKLMLSYERNTMWWEVQMLKLMKKHNIPAPELLFYDDTLTVCKSPYFFMSYIEGRKLSDYKGLLDKESRSSIEQDLGKICCEISKLESKCFFIPSYNNINFSNNFEFIKNLFNSLILDAESKNIVVPNYNYEDFITILEENQSELNSVKKICLVHSDMWDGNIIIKDGKVSGIVDFADLYFCDELFNFYFHTLNSETSKSFIKGFGKADLSNDEKIRVIIYRIFVILKMIVEKDYKKFNGNNENFAWLYEKLDKEMSKLVQYKKSNVKVMVK